MAEAYYEPTPATDGATMNPVPGAVFQVFEIADTTFSTPLSLRVGSGNPTTTVAASDTLATLPGVYVTSDNFEHIWVSGSFQWRRDSIDGAKGAIQRAESSALAAANAAADVQLLAESGAFIGEPGPKGDRGLPGLNAVENDVAFAAAVSTPGTETNTALSATTAGIFGGVVAGLSETATGDANRVALQSAVDAAAGLNVFVPDGSFHIAGTVNVSIPLRVVGSGVGVTTIIQDAKATPIFKVDAPDCGFYDMTWEGQGLDVTGHPLLGAGSFRGHAGVWATLRSHRLTIANVVARDLVIGVYIRDYLAGETPAYLAPALEGLQIRNLHCENVWVGVEGGALKDPNIVGVTGTYAKVTGTPTNGDTGSPPHLVYVASDLDHMSTGGFYDRISTSGITVDGGPLKVKHSKGFTVGKVTAHASRGLSEFESCYDFNVESLVSTEDGYLDTGISYGRGTVWFVDCHRGTAKIRVSFASGAHGSAIWTNSTCTDLTFDSPVIHSARTTPSADGIAAMRITGDRNRIKSPIIHSAGSTMWAAILVDGINSQVTDPTITGSHGRNVTGPLKRGVIDYDPALALPSRFVAAPMVFDLTADATVRTIIRDRSVGQAVTAAFSDDFAAEPGRIALAHTDDSKLWETYGPTGFNGGVWKVVNGGSRYDGGSPRALAVVNGRKADGVLTATIKTLPIDGGEGLVFRAVDGENYLLVVPWMAAGDHRLRFLKRVNGTLSEVGVSTAQAVVGDVITVTLAGTTVTVALNGTTAVTGTVADFSTATRHGLAGTSAAKTFQTSRISFV